MSVSQVSAGGLRGVYAYQLYTASGLPYASSAGADPYSGLHVNVAKAFRPNIPEAQVLQITGDDRPAGQIVLAGNETVSVEFTTAKANLTADALFGDVNVVSQGDQRFIVRESDKRGCEPVVGMMAYQQAIDNTVGSASRGSTFWRAQFIPKAKVVSMSGPQEEGNALESRYMAYAQVVNAHLWGMAFASGTEGATEAQMIEMIFAGPPVLDTWLIDAVPTLTLNLSETALVGDAAGLGYDIQIFLWNHSTGAVTNITATASATASTITVVGAVEDDMVMAIYSKAGC